MPRLLAAGIFFHLDRITLVKQVVDIERDVVGAGLVAQRQIGDDSSSLGAERDGSYIPVFVLSRIIGILYPCRYTGDQGAFAQQLVFVDELKIRAQYISPIVVVDRAGNRVVVGPVVVVDTGLEQQVPPLLLQPGVEEQDLGIAAGVLPGILGIVLLARILELFVLLLTHRSRQLQVGCRIAQLGLQGASVFQHQSMLQPQLVGVEFIPAPPAVFQLPMRCGDGHCILIIDISGNPEVQIDRTTVSDPQLDPVGI